MKELTGKRINIELSSKGWGIEDFMDEYGYSSEDEFREGLKNVTSDSNKIDGIIRNMKKNSKKKKKSNKASFTSNSSDSKSEEAKYKNSADDSMKTPVPYTVVNVPELLKTAETSIQNYEKINAGTSKPMVSKTDKIIDNLDVSSFEVGNFHNHSTALDNVKNESKTVQENEKVSAEKNENVIPAEVVEVIHAPTDEEKTETKLKELNNQLQSVNEQIISSEKSIKGLNYQKRKISIRVDEIWKAISRIEESLLLQKKKFEKAYADNIQVKSDTAEEKSKLKQLQLDKEEIMSQIRELVSITLYCEETEIADKSFDHTISKFEFTNQVITEKLTSFFEGDFEQSSLLDEFSVLELKRVAKIVLAAEQISQDNDNSKVDLYFNCQSNLTGLLELMGNKVIILK